MTPFAIARLHYHPTAHCPSPPTVSSSVSDIPEALDLSRPPLLHPSRLEFPQASAILSKTFPLRLKSSTRLIQHHFFFPDKKTRPSHHHNRPSLPLLSSLLSARKQKKVSVAPSSFAPPSSLTPLSAPCLPGDAALRKKDTLLFVRRYSFPLHQTTCQKRPHLRVTIQADTSPDDLAHQEHLLPSPHTTQESTWPSYSLGKETFTRSAC